MTHRDRLAAWERDLLGPALARQPERKAHFETPSGIPLDRLYVPTDDDPLAQTGFPGEFPFTRGPYPAMYRQSPWIFGLYSGFGSAEETNQRFRHLLAQGQTGFSVALDLPTQVGYDPDHPLAEGEVGRVGVSLSSLADMERLFAGIPFDQVRQIRTTANAIGPIFAAMVICMARRQGVDPRSIKLFIQNDVLKEYIARGTQIYPPAPSLRHSVDLVEYCAANGLDTWTPLAVSGYHIRDAGATAVQELAFSFSNAIAYFDEAVRRGIDVDRFAPRIWAFLASDIHLLEEVAKFRAARRVWAKLLRDRYGATDPDAMALKIFGFTLGGRLTAQQPLNNIVRVTVMALAAALGGVSTLHTTAYDEALAVPTEAAATLALRTQQIIAHETGVTDVVDMLGGSWALEQLTGEIERRVFDALRDIEQRGGAVRCIESGWFGRALGDQAYQYQLEIERKERVVVGVNEYRTEGGPQVPVFRVDRGSEGRIIDRVRELKAGRDRTRLAAALDGLRVAAHQGMNTMGPLIAAVDAYATVGEICEVLRDVWGTFTESVDF
ncbi:MAG: methylmalonyl-CoA mutase, N-terminal domain [Symbiobacteriaceae bacterium]|jgi:methylmalonyl-CoA mutase N-terminal domain/subunit|nr:methylmalonyl-CoA mutase, N-terminal domain [Symbiobacteriaceae bacterium]